MFSDRRRGGGLEDGRRGTLLARRKLASEEVVESPRGPECGV